MNQNPAGNSTLTIAPRRVPDGLLMIWTTSEFGCWKRILSQHALHHGLLEWLSIDPLAPRDGCDLQIARGRSQRGAYCRNSNQSPHHHPGPLSCGAEVADTCRNLFGLRTTSWGG